VAGHAVPDQNSRQNTTLAHRCRFWLVHPADGACDRPPAKNMHRSKDQSLDDTARDTHPDAAALPHVRKDVGARCREPGRAAVANAPRRRPARSVAG
jgi:hypothetical protein